MATYVRLKPTVSSWVNFSGLLKFLIPLALVILIICFVVLENLKRNAIQKIYKIQDEIKEMYSFELEFIDGKSPDEDSWLSIADLDGHIYSAYLDTRPEVLNLYSSDKSDTTWALIRIIAILPTEIDDKNVQCIYKFRDGNHEVQRKAVSAKAMQDNWSLKYSAFFVLCGLEVPEILNYDDTRTKNPLPVSISIGFSKKEQLNFVDIHYPKMGFNPAGSQEHQFMAICVPVLHHSFNRPLDVVEFVEYYLKLGATHITFYNSSITPDVSKVLDFYVKQKVATVLQWQLPPKYIYERNLRHEALFANINDCLYRNAFYDNYEYVGLFGLDEFLVPRVHDNFIDLMENFDPKTDDKDDDYASFVFRNVFFYTMYEDSILDKDPDIPYMYTQAKTLRLVEPNEPGDFSRYIVRGRDVIELGNYQVVELRQGSSSHPKPFQQKVVDPKIAISHRYAPCEAEDTACYLKPTMRDRSAKKFSKSIEMNVHSACENIFPEGGCRYVQKQKLE